jgi:acyl-coenzyme A thioesterase PaaI-like protein
MTAPPLASSLPDRDELVFPESGLCFGCSPLNAAGLRLRFFRDGDGVRAETTMAPEYQGAPGVVHGGMQAVLLDEISCAAAFFLTGTRVMTGSLDLRYRRACPTGERLGVRAVIARDEGRYLVIRAAIHTVGEGAAVTESEGRFYRRESQE